MKMNEEMHLGIKWLLGAGSSGVAAATADGTVDWLHQMPFYMGMIISVLTAVNLSWTFADRVARVIRNEAAVLKREVVMAKKENEALTSAAVSTIVETRQGDLEKVVEKIGEKLAGS